MIFEENKTVKHGKDTYNNNIENSRIYKNDEQITDYAIQVLNEDNPKVIVQRGIHITEMNKTDIPNDILEAFLQPTPTTKKKTTKTTIKGKKTKEKDEQE